VFDEVEVLDFAGPFERMGLPGWNPERDHEAQADVP
jgi:hypothetical protein